MKTNRACLNSVRNPLLLVHQLPGDILHPARAGTALRSRICICCGELIVERGNSMSRNPNVCASCSSLADGMGAEGNQPEGDDGFDRGAGFSVPIGYKQSTR